MSDRSVVRPMALGVVLLAAGALGVHAQDAPDVDEMMAKMMELATPGEHHSHLAQMEGTWKAHGKFWMQPGAPPTESVGTMKNSMTLGGRFLRQEFEGEFMGRPFTGFGIEGYDRGEGEHVAVWMDSMGTMMMVSHGRCSDGGKVRTLVSEFKDPATGVDTKMKFVTTVHGPDKHVMEAYTVLPDMEPMKTMEITYTR